MDLPPGICLLVADQGIGDHYLVAGFAEAVRRRHGVRIWMAGREHLAFVRDLFPAVECYIEWPKTLDPLTEGAWKIAPGVVYYAHFPKLELMRAVGYNGFHFLDAYRCRLDLPPQALLSRARRPGPAEIARAEQALRTQGFTAGRTVVLSLDARTTPTDGVAAAFWSALGEELTALGLEPLVNAGPATCVPAGLRSLALPLPEFRAMVQAAGFMCSVRNGLSDLVCDLRCPQVVVYPDVRYWAGPLRAGTTFDRYGLVKPPHEVTVARGQSTAEIREIAGFFAARVPGAMAGSHGAPVSLRSG